MYIDKQGNRAYPHEFEAAFPFSQGLAAVRVERHWVYMNRASGEQAFTGEYDRAEAFADGIARVYLGRGENPRVGYIDRNGEYVWFPTH